jgi:hypothetical protein
LPIRRKPVELVYGKSGSGKTTWWLKLAKHFWEHEQKKTRCYHGMGGEETIYAAIDQGELPEEAISIFDYAEKPFPGETLQLCTEGYWPDANGKFTRDIPSDVGFFVFEGLTAMSNAYMAELAQLATDPKHKFGQDTPILFTSGQTKEGGNPPSHFGIAQRKILKLIENTRTLPGWVLWTAHETDAEDKETQEKLVGPAVAGKALASKIGGSFGNTIHLDSASKRVKQRDQATGKDVDVLITERRAYFTEHFDPEGLTLKKYFANNRAFNPDRLPKCGYITPPDPVTFYNHLKGTK